MTVYQVLLRLLRSGKFSSVDKTFLCYLQSLGVTHLYLTGVIRHSTGKDYVKGDWGSPYSISDYYDVNPYLADNPAKRLDEFKSCIDRCHNAGIKVLIDFVPNHVSPDYSDAYGGIPCHSWYDYDWTDTRKINYSDPLTSQKMTDIVRFWASQGVDGFRCDMVELVPLWFFTQMISAVKSEYPDCIFIGEAYGKENYRPYIEQGGFDFLYDKSGLYDTLRAIITKDHSCREITGNWQWLSDLQGKMLNFLENHDEQRIPFWAGNPLTALPALAVSILFYPAPFMLYFGQECGEAALDGSQGRTSIFNHARAIDPHTVIKDYKKLLELKRTLGDTPNYDLCYCQSWKSGFDPDKHFVFNRGNIIVACNFSSKPAHIRLLIPKEASGKPEASYEDVCIEANNFTIQEFS